jgi:hypothetical protein
MEVEKQKFFMEVLDILEARGPEMEIAAKALIKEAIRSVARTGQKQYNIPSTNMNITVTGLNIPIGPATLLKIKEFLLEEGFTIAELNGYNTISWQ